MFLYLTAVVLHALAAFVWIGHMIFWSIIVGPLAKRHEPPEEGEALKEASAVHGGMGWPALAILFVTGLVMLHYRGCLTAEGLGDLRAEASGWTLGIKLVLVGGMVFYQARIGHRPAPRAIYLNMLAAVLIFGLSVLIVRYPGLTLPGAPE